MDSVRRSLAAGMMAPGAHARPSRRPVRAHNQAPKRLDAKHRLTRAQLVSVVAEALFTVSLAGSLFFSVSVEAARPRVLLYLLVTVAPFVVVGPFAGPVVDRLPGGQRVVIAVSCLGRAVVSVVIASQLNTLLFFPLAFLVLVISKGSSVARSALVPWLVPDAGGLVAANARLSRVATVAGGVALAGGAGILSLTSARVVLGVAAVGYLCAAVLSLRIPRPRVTAADGVVTGAPWHGAALRLAANAMIVARGSVGFLAFLLAFNLKARGEPTWVFGVAIVAGGAGALGGTFVAPFARRRLGEAQLLVAALLAPGFVVALGAVQYRRSSALLAAFAIGVGANVGRQAFDSMTQRLAPDAEKGRAFAHFETQFQVAWVTGAVGAVLAKPSAAVGLAMLGGALCGEAGLYAVGLRALGRHAYVVAARDIEQADLPGSMLSLAEGLYAQGAERMAVLTAVGAARAARAAGRHPDADTVNAELEGLWGQAVIGDGALPSGAAEHAIALARLAVRPVGGPGISPPS
jgi:hypothetical protein